MSATSKILAFGKYNVSIEHLMDYNDTTIQEGDPVLLTVMQCDTTNQSRELAKAYGMSSLTDLHNACMRTFDPKSEFAKYLREEFDNAVEAFTLLSSCGFIFMFDPEC